MVDMLSRRHTLKGLTALALATPAAGQRAVADAGPIQVEGAPVELSFTPVSAETLRLSIQALDSGQPRPIPLDGALVETHWPAPAVRLRQLATASKFLCGDLHVGVLPDPLTIRIERQDGSVLQEIRCDTKGGFSFALGDGPILGLGQGGPQFDRRGTVDSMLSGQDGYRLETNGSKVPIPLLVGTSGWALYVHHPAGGFDLSGERGRLLAQDRSLGMPLDLFVIGAAEPAMILAEYAKITGYAELPPLWAFGYQQSHRTLGSPEEILAEARLFREKKLPCDAMIYLGTGFCPNGWNIRNGEFAWNPRAFPEPQHAIDQLHDDHFKVVLHIVLEGERLSGAVTDPCTAPPLPSGQTADGQWPPDRQVSCYWPFHRPLTELGIDGWWPDQGDGLDGPSRLARNRMYFEGQQLYRPNQRVYALHRNGSAGMQRYAAFLWSGDVDSTWETLKTHIPVAINAGLSGIPYWGTDIGGFVPTEEYSGELFARWFQFAAFTPLFRSHGRDWRLHLPWGWTLGQRGFPETRSWHPAAEDLHDPRVEPICRTYLTLRYQLLPYLYSVARETCDTGLPIIRALWLHHPDDPLAVGRGDLYLYGRDILVAPVVEKGATSRRLYLPAGTWYDFWDNTPRQGGGEITRAVDLATLPLYVRAGALLPMGPPKQYVDEAVDEPLSLWIYPGADGAFSLYEDDGKTFDYRRGVFSRLNFTWSNSDRRLRIAAGIAPMTPPPRDITLRVAGEAASRRVAFDGRSIELVI